jgi:RHS repeat-associated protein
MRQGSGTLNWLLGDHLGSTAITINSGGTAEDGELRYYPYGETRYTSGSTPTSYRFTGQREDATIGLYFYNARYYDASLGRFVQADSMVPEPGNPQSLNRYSYCLGNPLRYVDPSGYYSEEEIMQAFGVSTWDEVLAFFKQGSGSELEGLWGWLEILRQAQDADFVSGSYTPLTWSAVEESMGSASIGHLRDVGWFWRDKAGHIFVSDMTHMEFAAVRYEYTLYRGLSEEPVFSTQASTMYFHPHLVFGDQDLASAAGDAAGILIDYCATVALVNIEATPANEALAVTIYAIGVAADAVPATVGLGNIVNRHSTARFESGDMLDVAGVIPILGVPTDVVSLLSNLAGVRVVWTP